MNELKRSELVAAISRVGLGASIKDGLLNSLFSESSGGAPVLTNVLTKNMFGRFKTYTPADNTKAFTTNFGIELESGFEAVRFGILNLHTSEISGAKFSVAVSNKNHSASYVQDSQPSTGVWIDGNFPTMPARYANELPSLTWGEWVGITDIPQLNTERKRPILMGRIEMPAGAVCTVPFNGMQNWNDITITPRLFRAVSQAVAGVTTKASWVGGVNPNNPQIAPTNMTNAMIPVIQYVSRSNGRQVLIVGDSTAEGLGATVKDLGAVQTSVLNKSTPEVPIEYYNAGIHSQGYSVYSRVPELYADAIKPTDVFYQPWSVNDSVAGGHTDLMIEGLKGANGKVIAKLQSLPKPPKLYFLEPLPVAVAFKNLGVGDAKRRDYIEDYLPKLTAGVQVKGYAEVLSGAEVAGQTTPKPEFMFDSAHPNTAGYNALSSIVDKYL